MQNMDPIQEATDLPQTMWYRTRAGKIFLGILAVTLVLTIGFFTLTGYYVWQIKFGIGAEKLEEQFNPKFTADPTKINSSSSDVTTEELSKLIYPTTSILGKNTAPVTIFVFVDFECPFSQEVYPTFKQITEKYVPIDIVRIVFKHIPIESINKNAMQAHLASACAEEQGKFWEYYNLLFTEKKLESSALFDYADRLKLDTNRFKSCLDSKKYQSNIDKDMLDAANLGIRGTPTYFINQTKVEGVTTKDAFDKIILEEMQKSL